MSVIDYSGFSKKELIRQLHMKDEILREDTRKMSQLANEKEFHLQSTIDKSEIIRGKQEVIVALEAALSSLYYRYCEDSRQLRGLRGKTNTEEPV